MKPDYRDGAITVGDEQDANANRARPPAAARLIEETELLRVKQG